ncbi:MAG: 30S ribosome-binding factor RbfA [Candidatus Eisenbacteria bacterium]|nr:30S ribosome-binding factor RbfA [Candidatus Eisenbacteria bacterium]
MKGTRLARVEGLIRTEVADILDSRMRDPRLGMVTVTGVEVGSDLRNATVFVSFLVAAEEFEPKVRLLNEASAFVWRELASRGLELRHLPKLHFKADHSLERAQRIQQLLRETAEADEAARTAAPAGAGPVDDEEPPAGDDTA